MTTYVATLNNLPLAKGDLPEIRNAIADLVTRRINEDPEGLATDAHMINIAFSMGAVLDTIVERGEWYTVFGAFSENPARIRIVAEG